MTKLALLTVGNFNQCKSVGDGVHELKIEYGPGYRVYFKNTGNKIIIIFTAGSKKTQDKDIQQAKEYAKTV